MNNKESLLGLIALSALPVVGYADGEQCQCDRAVSTTTLAAASCELVCITKNHSVTLAKKPRFPGIPVPNPPTTNPFKYELPHNWASQLEQYRQNNESFRVLLETNRLDVERLRMQGQLDGSSYLQEIKDYKVRINAYKVNFNAYRDIYRSAVNTERE